MASATSIRGRHGRRTYYNADKVQLLQLVVLPSLRQLVSLLFVFGVEEAVDWNVCRLRIEERRH